jgi:hypothetical protein
MNNIRITSSLIPKEKVEASYLIGTTKRSQTRTKRGLGDFAK